MLTLEEIKRRVELCVEKMQPTHKVVAYSFNSSFYITREEMQNYVQCMGGPNDQMHEQYYVVNALRKQQTYSITKDHMLGWCNEIGSIRIWQFGGENLEIVMHYANQIWRQTHAKL